MLLDITEKKLWLWGFVCFVWVVAVAVYSVNFFWLWCEWCVLGLFRVTWNKPESIQYSLINVTKNRGSGSKNDLTLNR
jgi:hypothetical protein